MPKPEVADCKVWSIGHQCIYIVKDAPVFRVEGLEQFTFCLTRPLDPAGGFMKSGWIATEASSGAAILPGTGTGGGFATRAQAIKEAEKFLKGRKITPEKMKKAIAQAKRKSRRLEILDA